jgi:hypothetical protein
MNNASAIIRDDKYYILPELFNDLGGTSPADIILVGELQPDSPNIVGHDLLRVLQMQVDRRNRDKWNDPKYVDEKANALGFKNYDALRRGAKYIYVDTANDTNAFYAHRPLGSRSPSFEGIAEVSAKSLAPRDLGATLFQALLLCP